ncbi:MAG: hypothetical protein ACXAEN_20135 [Candidatus Thorarchaeota archaeon]|jgi:hypothetical protein
MPDKQMSDFRTVAEQEFCQEYCNEAMRFPTDNCRRCWIDCELAKVRRTWHHHPFQAFPEELRKFGWCAEDMVGYCFGRAVRGEL